MRDVNAVQEGAAWGDSAASEVPLSTSSLRDYLQVVWRRKFTIATIAVLVPAAVLAYSLSQQPLYRATAEVVLSQDSLTSGLTGGAVPLPQEDPDRFAVTQARLARTTGTLRPTLAATGVAEPPAQLRASSSVSAAPDSDFLEFAVTNPSDRLAARLATEYARQFTLYRSRLDSAALIRARADISTRLSQLAQAHQSHSRLYSSLLTEQQRLTTLELLQTPRAVLVDKPTAAAKVRPRPVRNTVVGAAFGVLLAFTVAFLLDTLDTRIFSAAELAEALGLRLLGKIPTPPRRIPRPRRLVMLVDAAGPQGEAFRELRLNFDLRNLEAGARLVVVTSALSGEDQSATAANLAIACARAGRDVLLVDCDLRTPQLHQFFGIDARPGLTDVTLGRAELDAALARVQLPATNESLAPMSEHHAARGGLTILPAGVVPPDPGSVVDTESLATLLTELRTRYELVFIDTPPLLQAADGIALGSQVDGLIVVARASTSRRPTVRKLRQVLEVVPALKLGLVITDESGAYGDDNGYGDASAEDSHPGATAVAIDGRAQV
jgi:capsular exopolysaccharide synthesis family protein